MENKQYLTFCLHDLQYGIDASLVQEIFPLPELTPITEAPTDMIGILNLRGQIVPMMHLDLLQEHPLKNCHISDNVIILKWDNLQIGLVVHQVNKVLELNSEVIETEPIHKLFGDVSSDFIAGVAKVDLGDIVLLKSKTLIHQPDAVLTLIWDAQIQLDVMAAARISEVEEQLEQYYSDKADLTPLAPLPYQGMGESISPLSNKAAPLPSPRRGGLGRGGEGLGERLTEQPGEELQTLKTLPSFYDLYCPNVTPEERAIFRARADDLRQAIESLKVTKELIPLAVIGFDNEYFGLDLELVQEFINVGNLTPIPCCPNHIVGNMNLRGEIVTLVDIRSVLNLPMKPVSVGSPVVVVQVDDIVAGLPVDRVVEMIDLNSTDMTPLPETVSDFGKHYLRGTALVQDKILKILDLPKIFTKGNLAVNEEV
jgi:purine-binding chemotaxis protein CheW